MKTSLLLLLAFAAATMHAQTRHDITMTVDGTERQCIVVRPSGAAPANGYPVVFMFHGTSGDGEKFYNISGWKEKGEAEKFITVFPSSLRYCFIDDDDTTKRVSTTKWNCGESQEKKCENVVLKDDIAFVRAIVDTVKRMAPVNDRRIYCSGFSNGGVFTSKLAVEMSDVFAAAACAGGGLHEDDSAMVERPIPMAFTFGDNDRNVVAAFGRAVPFNDTCLGVFRTALTRYMGVQNLAPMFTRDSTVLALVYRFTTPASSGSPSAPLLFGLMKNLNHEYPNGTNYPIAAADFLWTFFSGHSLPSSVGTGSEAAPGVSVYPNPASSYLMLKGSGRMTVTLTTLLGQQAFSATATAGQRIDLPPLARGTYVAEIAGSGARTATVIVIE